jgi:restriction system protein
VPIPDFQTIMLPLLRLTGDGAEHTLIATVQAVADEFHLTLEERAQPLPHAHQTVIYNRVAWASSYLRYAALLISTGRGRFRITQRGQDVLASPPKRIDILYLMQFPEFKAFREGAGTEKPPVPKGGDDTGAQTPEEAIASGYAAIRASVEQELLEWVKAASPSFFEQLIVQLLVAMGYGGSQEDAGKAVGQTGDGGIDGVIKEDRLGLDTIFLQAKRWDSTVGRPTVQAFAGALAGKHARRGVLITTSTFSADARAYVGEIEQRIVLINGRELTSLMFEYGVGAVPIGQPYELKRVDLDFFDE